MSFDASKDKVLWSVDITSTEKISLELSLRSYDGGPEKIQISRFGVKADGSRYYPKLGRLTKDEMSALIVAWKTRSGASV